MSTLWTLQCGSGGFSLLGRFIVQPWDIKCRTNIPRNFELTKSHLVSGVLVVGGILKYHFILTAYLVGHDNIVLDYGLQVYECILGKCYRSG